MTEQENQELIELCNDVLQAYETYGGDLSGEQQIYRIALSSLEGNHAAIVAAAEKLVRCKGRYHSEQNYRALAALFGVTVPDLEPLAGEGNSSAVPNGWKLVPVEPSIDMVEAGAMVVMKGMNTDRSQDCWAEMLSVAPQPPAPG